MRFDLTAENWTPHLEQWLASADADALIAGLANLRGRQAELDPLAYRVLAFRLAARLACLLAQEGLFP